MMFINPKESLNYAYNNINNNEYILLDVDRCILMSALVYKYLYDTHFITDVEVINIIKYNIDIGKIGSSPIQITCCEFLFKNSKTMHIHSCLHDAYGRFYNQKDKIDLGYLYSIKQIPRSLRN